VTLAHGTLLAGAFALLAPAVLHGAVQWQDDTKYFYYPLLANLAAALKEGRLPLWEPGIFGGYPLFADGESGMLYPPHVIALRLLEPAAALVALRLVRFYLAGAFTYAFLRVAGCTRPAAVAGGLAFMCSGFMVGQVVHENLDSGMVWLPLALYFVERAVRSAGGSCYRLAAFAGVAVAMQALAVHVQICVFTALAVGPYLGWRVLFFAPMRISLVRRAVAGAGMGVVMGGVAAGLSAVQLLPLLDLAARSARGHGIGLSAATINSVTPFRLLTVVFPELLRRPDGTPFGHWVDWEVNVSLGVPAVLLALVAVALRRDRQTLFFGALAALSLALSMGRYGPPWVVTVTQDLLGDHGLRSPGRFAFLWSFGVAALVGFGLDWLMRAPQRAPRLGRLGRLGQLWLGLTAGLLAGGLAGLLLTAQAARQWLLAHPVEAGAWLERQYVAFDRSVKLKVTGADAHASLLAALDPHAPTMRVWVASVVAAYAVFAGWCLLRSTGARGRRMVAMARAGLSLASVLAVVGPLLVAAGRAHPASAMAAIEPNSGAAGYLAGVLAPASASVAASALKRPLYRVYTGQAVYLGRSDVEPNALLPLGVQEAGGYSSLSTERHMAYAWAAETSWGRMLDVWNARYVVAPNTPETLPSHELTSFHPLRPLVSGNGANSGARGWFRVPAVEAENVRVVATLRDSWGAQPGDVAGWVVAEDEGGERLTWPLRVGLEVAEATAGDPAMRAERSPELAASPGFPLAVHTWKEYAADGSPYDVKLYYAKLPLPQLPLPQRAEESNVAAAPRKIVRLGVQAAVLPTAPHAILRVHGLGVGQPDWWVHNMVWQDRERLTAVDADEEVQVYRNETALPRAYLVPLAAALPQAHHVKQMAERPFDPERMVLIDPADGAPPVAPVEDIAVGSWFHPPAAPLTERSRVVSGDDAGWTSHADAGDVQVAEHAGGRVVLAVIARAPAWLFLADTYDPAWRAYVDGRPTQVFLANGMFRAVAVPEGEHQVNFRYEPPPLERGAAVSLVTGVLVLIEAASGAVRSRRA